MIGVIIALFLGFLSLNIMIMLAAVDICRAIREAGHDQPKATGTK